MADLTKMAPSEIAEEHATEAHAPYIKVWVALAVLTADRILLRVCLQGILRGPARWACCSGP